MSHAFSTVASERARETKAREELRRQQQRVETTEKFSGLRIKNRLVASAVLEDKFADLRFARIPDVKLDMRGRWATAGVLVEKTMKQGSTGSSYSIWKLSDMSPTDYVFTVFLFGQAHLDWHREDPGTVWAVVDGELREDCKAGPAGRPTAACNEPHQLCKLGTSPVFGRCKGTRRDGNNCTMHVNTSVSNYCAFHANAALKSLATERMALGPGRAAKFVHNGRTVVGARGLGGRVNVPPSAAALANDGNRDRRRVEPREPRAYTADQVKKLAAKNQHSSMTGRGAALVTGGAVGGKRAHPGLGGRVRDRDGDDQTGRAAAAALAGPGPLGSVPGGGGPSRFGSDPRHALVSRAHVLANKKARTETAPAADGKGKAPYVTADSGFGGGFGGFHERRVDAEKEKENRRRDVPSAALTDAPKPRDAFVAMEEDDDFDADLDALSAVARARAVAKSIKPHDPNAFRRATKEIRVDPTAAAKRVAPPPLPGLAPAATKAPAKTASKPWPVPGTNVPAPSPRPPGTVPTALGAAFGDVAEAHADGASRYAASAEALERDRLMARLSQLEERDRLHTQVSETHILHVKCSMCECGSLFEGRQKDSCARAGHRARTHETKKRFFKCGACPFRTTTLGKPFPPTPCPRCRCEDWDKCGMSAAAERTKAGAGFGEDVGNREGMLARGIEHGFSLRGGEGFAGSAGHLESEMELR